MVLTLQPTVKQDEAWQILEDKVTTDFLFGGGAGGGKSWLGCEWLITNCLRYPETRYFIARKTLKNLKKTTLRTFFKVARFHGLIAGVHYVYQEQAAVITFLQTGSTIDLLEVEFRPSDPNYDDLGSSEYTSGWLEEAQEIDFNAYDTLKTRIGRQHNSKYGIMGKLYITCNPAKNWMYLLFYKPWKKGDLPAGYRFLRSLIDDNPKNEPEYKSKLLNITDIARKQRLLDGTWEYDEEGVMIDFDAITDLFTNTLADAGDKYLVVDAARFGGDRIVFTFWRGLLCYKTVIKTMQATDRTEADIRDYAVIEQIAYSRILVDEDGIGGGIVDHLKGIKGFVANHRPFENPVTHEPENFDNLKSQCAYLLADKVNARLVAVTNDKEPERQQLIEELEQIKSRDGDKDGKRKIIPKDDVKRNIKRSPDYGDCFIMRMFFEIEKPKPGYVPPPTLGIVKKYPGMPG